MNDNFCVCCGDSIPEGMQVCKKCESELTSQATLTKSLFSKKT